MQSNRYTFIFATIVIVVAALVLSMANTLLKDRQVENERREKKTFILRAVGMEASGTEVDALYEKYINALVLDEKGNLVQGVNAFTIDLLRQEKMKAIDPSYPMQLPFYVFENEQGEKQYIFPVAGKGLWGPIWGFVALKSDLNTISGAIFDHKGETPGLGAEISTSLYQEQFVGKKLYEGNKLVSIDVIKLGEKPKDEHTVDGVSGGTVTSNGLEDMLRAYFNYFKPYLDQQRSQL